MAKEKVELKVDGKQTKDDGKKKKKDDENVEPSRKVRLKSFQDAYAKIIGSSTMSFKREKGDIPRISSGTYTMDWALGGGIPIGRISMFHGDDFSTKTSTAKRVVANSFKMCSACNLMKDECKCKDGPRDFITNWMAFEDGFEITDIDDVSGFVAGAKDDNFMITYPENAEQGFDIMDSMLMGGDVDIYVVDSIAMAQPEAERDAGTAKWQQGLQARLWNKMCRTLGSRMNEARAKFGRVPTVILINQLRYKITMFGDPRTKPGGVGQKFVTAYELDMKRGKPVYPKKGGDGENKIEPYAVEVGFSCCKARFSKPFISSSYKFMVEDNEVWNKKRGEILDEDSLKTDALRLGVIHKEKSLYITEDAEGAVIDISTKHADIGTFLLNNKDVAEVVRTRVLNILLKTT